MPIDEIVVTARRSTPTAGDAASANRPNTAQDPLRRDIDALDAQEDAIDAALERAESKGAFVAPAVPTVIEEIIATAPRAPALRVPLFGIGGLLTGAAAIGAEIARELSQQRLEEAFRVFEAVEPRKKDSPVRVIPEAEPIPEIIVRARRPIRRPFLPPNLFRFISPDLDPFEMVPIVPRTLPQAPTAVPQVDVPAPQIQPRTPAPIGIPPPLPLTTPTFFPDPATDPSPRARPLADPGPLLDPELDPGPLVQPDIRTQPGVRPFVQPGTRPGVQPRPLTPLQPLGVPFSPPAIFATPFAVPQAQPQPRARPQRCPPCKRPRKRKERKRKECFKKLVKEGVTPSKDRSFRWTQIDCVTGREL